MRTLFDAPPITVGELCRRIRSAIDAAFFARVRVAGEVSGCKVAPTGHVYFDLKDREGVIKCVCFRATAAELDVRFPMAEGTAVEIAGRVTAYALRSQFQIVVDDVVPTGRGDLHRQFELLKEKLRREGLFEPERKRPLPAFVRSVAIVTSRDSAALADFVTTCRRRGAHVAVRVVHSVVQGAEAAPALARAIAAAGRLDVDVVVVARGGGSIEDLWAFNTEMVARAIARCARPVVSAVGHETDVTIADFAADRRAATPTAAAEIVTPDRAALLARIASMERRLARGLSRAAADSRARRARAVRDLIESGYGLVDIRAQQLDEIDERLRALDPRTRAVELRRRIDLARERLQATFARAIADRRNALDVGAARLAALGPAATMRRGYSIVFDAQGGILTDAARTAAGRQLEIELHRGHVRAAVTATEERHGQGRFEED